MHCPRIEDIPSPEGGKSGWPWTEGLESLAMTAPENGLWPKISIVTPSFNQGAYIEETIRSVLLQGYLNLEYIIIDGGSNDETLEIIKKYRKWISYWTSESDNGQSHAINKGFSRASGQIFAYINSDDLYEPGALLQAAAFFKNNSRCNLIAGECVVFEGNAIKNIFKPWWPDSLEYLLKPFGSPFAQPASFWRRDTYLQVGGFNEDMHFCFDREFFLKLALAGHRPQIVSKILARYRHHRNTKTNKTICFHEESIPMINKYAFACGLTQEKKEGLIRQSREEISYLRVFIEWKNNGRYSALIAFAEMLLKTPRLILKRKIFGLLRRLLYFRTDNVAELSKV